jgi:thiamine biosynthesis protein ThiI
MDYIICHYSEIGLKGKNRRFFEEKLIDNIKRLVLKSDDLEFAKRISGRIIIKLTKKGIQRQKEIKEGLNNVFGIAYFSFAENVKPILKLIQEKAFGLLKDKKFKTFRITTQRSKKDFSLTSQEINEKVGEYILRKLKVKVDLEKPDIICFIEIVDKYAFLYLEKIQGPGGLPAGTGGKAVVLLSGGIDSPVASFCAMKRGVKIIFVHFHAYPYTSQASIEKTKKIASVLRKYQGKSKLYLVPFGEIQKEVLIKTSARLRVVLYRRMMFKIAGIIAKEEWATAIITGESIGQVASQTLENIRTVEDSVDLPVLRPLITEDKEEIIRKAKKIGTFEISILPDEDCCSRFLPAHPATKANLNEVKREENKLNINKLIKEAVHKASLVQI